MCNQLKAIDCQTEYVAGNCNIEYIAIIDLQKLMYNFQIGYGIFWLSVLP